MRTFSIITLGCRVNQCESDEIAQGLTERGWENAPVGEIPTVVIVNTCTVTGESDRKSRQMIRRAAAQGSHVVVTGCFAQIAGEEAAKIPGVVYVCGNDRKAKIPAVLSHIDALSDTMEGTLAVDVDTDDMAAHPQACPILHQDRGRLRESVRVLYHPEGTGQGALQACLRGPP